jgi:hypothetical protein
MNTLSVRQPNTLSIASMLVAAGAVAISVVAISTDDVAVPSARLVPVLAPAGVEPASVAAVDAPCRPPLPNVGLC